MWYCTLVSRGTKKNKTSSNGNVSIGVEKKQKKTRTFGMGRKEPISIENPVFIEIGEGIVLISVQNAHDACEERSSSPFAGT